MIKVLVVEDSTTARGMLTYIINSDPALQVVGEACNGKEALIMLSREKPDVVTMDIMMPIMDGYEATRRIMETDPVPIVVISANNANDDVDKTFKAVEAGAVAVLEKPVGVGHPDYDNMSTGIVRTIKAMSEVKVVKRRPKYQRTKASIPSGPKSTIVKQITSDIKLIAIGASTGGPIVLKDILSVLPEDYAVPVLIVQHIAEGFTVGFVKWLDQHSNVSVRIAENYEPVLPGNVYVAPDSFHMEIGKDRKILLKRNIEKKGHCPSVANLFRSVAEVYGKSVVGVLLTGMGKDGAEELKLIKEAGGITIAQDEESSVVHGMPGEAIKLGAAMYTLTPEETAASLVNMINKRTLSI